MFVSFELVLFYEADIARRILILTIPLVVAILSINSRAIPLAQEPNGTQPKRAIPAAYKLEGSQPRRDLVCVGRGDLGFFTFVVSFRVLFCADGEPVGRRLVWSHARGDEGTNVGTN